MRSERTKGLLTKAVLMVSLLFGVVAVTGTTAEAQHWRRGNGRVVVVQPRFGFGRPFYPYRYGFYGSYYFPSTHVTEGQGYKDGLDDGKHDAKHNKGYDPQQHSDYKNAQTSAYLEGYTRGYAEGFGMRSGD